MELFGAGQGAWVVVNTHPHREPVALENLARQGFPAYCPSVRRRITHARRTRDVLRPLFPGYLFVHVNSDQLEYRPILSTRGVRTLVRFGQRPSFLEDAFIRDLKSREVEGVIVRPPSPYKVGQTVSIAGGPFDGIAAAIIEMDEKDRLVVLMKLLNRSIKVEIRAEMVVADYA
jgi:transcriptional antiterminator RfaH